MTKTETVKAFVAKMGAKLAKFHATLDVRFVRYGNTDTGDAHITLTSMQGHRLEVLLEWDDPIHGDSALDGFFVCSSTNDGWHDNRRLEPVLAELEDRLYVFAKHGR